MANAQDTVDGLIRLLEQETSTSSPSLKCKKVLSDGDFQPRILTELLKVLSLEINSTDRDLELFRTRLNHYIENSKNCISIPNEVLIPRITHFTPAERNFLRKHRLEIHLDQIRWAEFKAVVEIDASSGQARICPLVEAGMEVATAICPYWDAPSKELNIVLVAHYTPTCDQWVIDLPGGVVERDENTTKAVTRNVKGESCVQIRQSHNINADANTADEGVKACNAIWADIRAAWGVQGGDDNDVTEPLALPKSSTSKGLLNETMQPWLLPLVELKPGAKVCRDKQLEDIDGLYLLEGEVNHKPSEKANQMKAIIAPWNRLGAILDELSTKTNEHGDSLYCPMITVSTLAYCERLQDGMTKIGKCLEEL